MGPPGNSHWSVSKKVNALCPGLIALPQESPSPRAPEETAIHPNPPPCSIFSCLLFSFPQKQELTPAKIVAAFHHGEMYWFGKEHLHQDEGLLGQCALKEKENKTERQTSLTYCDKHHSLVVFLLDNYTE